MTVVDCRSANQGAHAPAAPSSAVRWLRTSIFGAIVVLAALLRLPALDVRPMHADEAVHAAKFGKLLEQGVYQYDPDEYHGPTLNYLTLIPAYARGTVRYADLDEATLRMVPAVAGVVLVAAHLLLVPVLGFPAAAFAALFVAVSPAMVYYSRYYIQEMLLVAFTFGMLASVCRYLWKPGAGWAIGAGACLGLMAATKETWAIAFASMVAALVVTPAFRPGYLWGRVRSDGRRAGLHLALACISATAVSALFYSSFFSHPRGLVDAVSAYTTAYFARAGGASWHVQPWYYYFGILVGPGAGGPLWTEATILALALLGLVLAFRSARLRNRDGAILAFVGAYALLMSVAYAVIPYKTPWCLLGFLHGFILLAGAGAARLLAWWPRPRGRALVAGVLAIAAGHLAWLAWLGSTRFASDPRNPYVYAHTGPGVFEIVRGINIVARAHPGGAAMPIEVISTENLWPLPWYLRRFPAVRWQTAPVNDGQHAPLILITPEMEQSILRKLYEWRQPGERELYVPIFPTRVELRPPVEIRGYAAKSVWDRVVVR